MTLFANKYRIESVRLKGWDYSSNGAYYITICIKNRKCVFGKKTNEKMILSDLGKTAENCWREIPRHFPFVKLDEFVIMPNHVHGIIVIEKPMICNVSAKSGESNETHTAQQSDVSQQTREPNTPHEPVSNFGPQSKNIASIIRGFKIGVTKYAVNNNIPFEWQGRYYDHIIRDENDLNRIRKYIIENPSKWKMDEYTDVQSAQSTYAKDE